MTKSEFYDTTPRSFFNRLAGYREAEKQKELNEWKRHRFFYTKLINSTRPRKDQIKETDLLLIGDEIQQTKEISKEDAAKIFDKWDRDHKIKYDGKNDS